MLCGYTSDYWYCIYHTIRILVFVEAASIFIYLENNIMKENPSFYAVIPSDVRYSNIKANAKLLYWEITALANRTWECYASNKYFADLYSVSEKQVTVWVKELVDNWFIISRVERDNWNKRFISINQPTNQKVYTYPPKGVEGYPPKGVHNNTYINNINNINNIYPTGLENDHIEENINNKEIDNSISKHSIELKEKEKNSAKKEKEIPQELIEFFNKQKTNMPSINYQITKNNNYISWQIEFYNKLEKELEISWIKDYTKKDILAFIVKDQFWNKNIWSITKLLKKNNDWVPYWMIMIEKMKQQWYKKVWWRVLPNVKDINPF